MPGSVESNHGHDYSSVRAPVSWPLAGLRTIPGKSNAKVRDGALCEESGDREDHYAVPDGNRDPRFVQYISHFGDSEEHTRSREVWLLGQDSNLEPFG